MSEPTLICTPWLQAYSPSRFFMSGLRRCCMSYALPLYFLRMIPTRRKWLSGLFGRFCCVLLDHELKLLCTIMLQHTPQLAVSTSITARSSAAIPSNTRHAPHVLIMPHSLNPRYTINSKVGEATSDSSMYFRFVAHVIPGQQRAPERGHGTKV
jgi:hypothetical protein